MSLLVLMYHRATAGRHGNSAEMLERHFAHIASHHACILPGEPLAPDRLNVCLTFDDAYFDFYAVVFPKLRSHGLRAVLAVPPIVVVDHCDLPPETRLSGHLDVDQPQPLHGGFCTWTELREMAAGGRVSIAAHGFTHRRLDQGGVDLQTEVVATRTLLASGIGQPIESFMFPYGRFNDAALRLVREHYRYSFRIGGADNPNWDEPLLYRVTADAMRSADALFAPARRAGYRARRVWNRVRGR